VTTTAVVPVEVTDAEIEALPALDIDHLKTLIGSAVHHDRTVVLGQLALAIIHRTKAHQPLTFEAFIAEWHLSKTTAYRWVHIGEMVLEARGLLAGPQQDENDSPSPSPLTPASTPKVKRARQTQSGRVPRGTRHEPSPHSTPTPPPPTVIDTTATDKPTPPPVSAPTDDDRLAQMATVLVKAMGLRMSGELVAFVIEDMAVRRDVDRWLRRFCIEFGSTTDTVRRGSSLARTMVTPRPKASTR
jgi:hypothetical protein